MKVAVPVCMNVNSQMNGTQAGCNVIICFRKSFLIVFLFLLYNYFMDTKHQDRIRVHHWFKDKSHELNGTIYENFC